MGKKKECGLRLDLSWIGGHDQIARLKAHIAYITRTGKYAPKDDSDKDNNEIVFGRIYQKRLFDSAQEELKKRKDARVAGKLLVALPRKEEGYTQREVEEYVRDLTRLIYKVLGVTTEGWMAHEVDHLMKDSDKEEEKEEKEEKKRKVIFGDKNPHLHIIIGTRGKDGKKARINKKDLENLHKEWEKLLYKKGYYIKRLKKKVRKFTEHLGWRLHRDEDLKRDYIQHLKEREALEREAKEIREELEQKEKEEMTVKKEREAQKEEQTQIVQIRMPGPRMPGPGR